MKLGLADVSKSDGKKLFWVLGKTITMVTLHVPEDQKKEIDPMFIIEKGGQGCAMKWDNDLNLYAEESIDEAVAEWKKNVSAGDIVLATQMPDEQPKEIIL